MFMSLFLLLGLWFRLFNGKEREGRGASGSFNEKPYKKISSHLISWGRRRRRPFSQTCALLKKPRNEEGLSQKITSVDNISLPLKKVAIICSKSYTTK